MGWPMVIRGSWSMVGTTTGPRAGAGPEEVAMPVIVVTRLRLRDPAFFDEFFASAVAVVEQAQATEGNLSADVLAEANNTYWTRTAWQGRAAMGSFVGAGVDGGVRTAMPVQSVAEPFIRLRAVHHLDRGLTRITVKR